MKIADIIPAMKKTYNADWGVEESMMKFYATPAQIKKLVTNGTLTVKKYETYHYNAKGCYSRVIENHYFIAE